MLGCFVVFAVHVVMDYFYSFLFHAYQRNVKVVVVMCQLIQMSYYHSVDDCDYQIS